MRHAWDGDRFLCEKAQRWFAAGRDDRCPSPGSYCKFRTACIIWARSRERGAGPATGNVPVSGRLGDRGSLGMSTNGARSTDAPVERSDDSVGGRDMLRIVFFWASLCGACEAVALMLDVLALKWGDRVEVVEVNVEEEPAVAQAFRVRGIPTLVAVRGREVVGLETGARAPGAMEDLLARLGCPLAG